MHENDDDDDEKYGSRLEVLENKKTIVFLLLVSKHSCVIVHDF